MALIKHRERTPELAREWPFAMLPSWPWFDDLFRDLEGNELIKVEEFTEGNTLVVRAELPGIDPEKDVEITVEGGQLHINAHRSGSEEKVERNFRRREFRYGSFVRTVPLPEGVDDSAISADYRDGILEVRAPLPVEPAKEPARRVAVGHS